MNDDYRKTPQLKEVWFDYLVNNKKLWCNGFTKDRLEKVKGFVLSDNSILDDLFIRHGAAGHFLEEVKESNLFMFNHGLSNFSAAILDQMIEHKIYKIKGNY